MCVFNPVIIAVDMSELSTTHGSDDVYKTSNFLTIGKPFICKYSHNAYSAYRTIEHHASYSKSMAMLKLWFFNNSLNVWHKFHIHIRMHVAQRMAFETKKEHETRKNYHVIYLMKWLISSSKVRQQRHIQQKKNGKKPKESIEKKNRSK